MRGTVKATTLALVLALVFPLAAVAQERTPQTRAEVIEQQRRDKRARLWPERQSPIAEIVNGFVERGFLDGVTSGLGGGNGAQFVIGGMRSGQGLSLGVGYRRSDLLHDRFGFRATVRGTPELAWMADAQFYFPPLYTERGFLGRRTVRSGHHPRTFRLGRLHDHRHVRAGGLARQPRWATFRRQLQAGVDAVLEPHRSRSVQLP